MASWRANACRIRSGSWSQSRVLPSMSVKRKVLSEFGSGTPGLGSAGKTLLYGRGSIVTSASLFQRHMIPERETSFQRHMSLNDKPVRSSCEDDRDPAYRPADPPRAD